MIYQYIACSEAGDIVKGKISSDGEDAITKTLSVAGYRLINLKPYVPFLSIGNLTSQLFPIKPNDVILFYRQLSLLLESGINIVTSLELLRDQITKHSLKKVIGDIIVDIRGGKQLSVAMSRHPEVFSAMNCRTLSIGEQTGSLESMLKQVADYMEKELNVRKGVKGALVYPAIAGVVTIGVVGILMFFVLPSFANLYGSLGAQLPKLTQLMIDFSHIIRNYALYILLGIMLVVGMFLIYTRTSEGKYRLDVLMLKIPQLGKVNLLNELSRCCRSIGLLFTAGLPLTEIMPLVIQGSTNRVVSQALYAVQADMLKGEGLAKPMAKNPLFLPMMVQMVKVGEETGSLDTTLQAVAQNFESEAAEKTKTMIGLIPPMMTIIIAGFVGLIALSMVSAMYSIYGQAF
jgi:type IV pilus assembly protein PilC